ncbi:MAG: toll/interleukin-1 receptor domain-containing protein [Lachnospiraceae bacterium]|nr:toll/interleukin-1 receptor domain-containing protein [Lachnospiraceae bacterium]
MVDIFISYSSKDEQIANEICAFFEKEGVNCWIAPRNIEVGKEYGGEIIKGIEECKVFFLCLSKASNESQHVLREVERAVSRKLPIVVYQHEETVLSKSMEYFLASTQWFVPGKENGYCELVQIVKNIKDKKTPEKAVTTDLKGKKKKSKKWIWGFDVAAVILLLIGLVFFLKRDKEQVVIGDTFTYGSIDLTGSSKETLKWTVIHVDDESETALCIADNLVAFFPYDGAESGMRAQDGEEYYSESKLNEYTDKQLINFWGSSDWESANIRRWLNSDAAIVEYEGMKPTEDTASLYENGYETQAGFLHCFTEEEKKQLVETKVVTEASEGDSVITTDRVFLLSYDETMEYLVKQNFVLPAVPCENAVLLEGTGIYKEYYEEGMRSTYWATRTEGDLPCEVICAGAGLSETENFHSQYACSSLMGVRPVVVLPLEYIKTLEIQ